MSGDPLQSKTTRGLSPFMFSEILLQIVEIGESGFIRNTRSIPSFLACSNIAGLESVNSKLESSQSNHQFVMNILPAKHTSVAPIDFAANAVHKPSDLPPKTNTLSPAVTVDFLHARIADDNSSENICE